MTRNIAPEVSLDTVVLIDSPPDIDDLIVRQRVRIGVWVNSRLGQNFEGGDPSDPIDIGETDADFLVPG